MRTPAGLARFARYQDSCLKTFSLTFFYVVLVAGSCATFYPYFLSTGSVTVNFAYAENGGQSRVLWKQSTGAVVLRVTREGRIYGMDKQSISQEEVYDLLSSTTQE